MPEVQTKKAKKSKIVFTYAAPSARSVYICGSFNNWDEKSHALKKNGQGSWKITLELQPGRYEYRFIVDGGWECDQEVTECVPNAFGTWNSVVTIQ